METLPIPPDHIRHSGNEAPLCADTVSAAIQSQLGDHNSNGDMPGQQAYDNDDEDNSFSPSSTSRPSAATTRVNSGLTEHGLNMSIGDKLGPESGSNINPNSSINIPLPPPFAKEPNPSRYNERPDSFPKRVKTIRSLLLLFIASTTFMGLFTAFIVVVLIYKVVETPGGVFWDASTTNYVVSVLSQASALLTDTLIRDFFAVLRPVLASRRLPLGHPFKRRLGSSFATWVGLSPASGWSSVLQVAAVGGFRNPWCDMRLALPIMALAFGSILKFQANFEYYFIPGPPEASMRVYAGLTPPDAGLLKFINASDLAMYEVTWSASFLGVSQYARDFPMPNCDPSTCRSVFLPGGLPNARLVGHALNMSLYSFDTFSNYDTITIYNASGMVAMYEVPASDSLAFNLAEDCVYAGQAIDNGVQLCVKQDGESILVGWSACPIEIYDRGTCNTPNSTWRSDLIQSGTRMSLFSQRATTSYDKKNQSIINVQVDDQWQPKQIALSAKDYRQIFARALEPSLTSSAVDRNNVNTLGYTVAWFRRTFIKSFRTDRDTVVSNLHNLLAVPVQFSIVAHVYANYTVGGMRGLGDLGMFALPDEMISVARGGRSASRLAILGWAGWVFIAFGWALHGGVFAGIGWVVWRGEGGEGGEMGVQDLQAIRLAARTGVVYLGEEMGGKKGLLSRVGLWVVGVGGVFVPGRLRKWWVNGRDADVERFFKLAGRNFGDDRWGGRRHRVERGDESIMEEGRCLLDFAVEGDGLSALRLARAAQSGNVRIVMR